MCVKVKLIIVDFQKSDEIILMKIFAFFLANKVTRYFADYFRIVVECFNNKSNYFWSNLQITPEIL